MRFSPAQIRRYYDRNTSAFVAWGQGGSVGAIHRAVWGPGITRREDAFHFVEDRICERIRLQGELSHIVDLGCGVGASLCYLAEKLPISGTGITLSPVQASLAAERIQLAGLGDRIACVEGDFDHLPAGMRRADLAYAIESFVHAPSPERFFAQCRGLVRPGGLLVICDDFKRATADPAAASAIERFSRGWHVNTLIDPCELMALARDAGFAHLSTIELSQYLELRRPRDRAIAVLAPLLERIPGLSARLAPLVGGSALQECLARGWIGYDLVVFQRALSETQPAVDTAALGEEERNRWPLSPRPAGCRPLEIRVGATFTFFRKPGTRVNVASSRQGNARGRRRSRDRLRIGHGPHAGRPPHRDHDASGQGRAAPQEGQRSRGDVAAVQLRARAAL